MVDKLATPVRRTQAERRDGSERGVLQAAIAVVADEGVGAVTFDAVGRKGGFSRGLATQRFGSKQGLIEAVIKHLPDRPGTPRRGGRPREPGGRAAAVRVFDAY